jgi:hypothetical protein
MSEPIIPRSRQRLFQFGVATALLAVTLFAAILAYHVNWIRQRAALRQPEARERYGFYPAGSGPYLLRLFGEPGYMEVHVYFTQNVPELTVDEMRIHGLRPLTASERDEVERVQRLYPEALVRGGYKNAPVKTVSGKEVAWPFVIASEEWYLDQQR